nr:hypothetical protein [uncultured Undibacterium sp.]
MNNETNSKIEGTDEAWDSGLLGNDENYVRRASKKVEAEIDDALGMQLISIRLPKELIKELKIVAQFHDVGYQPLIRDALTRFASSEFKRIATEYANQKAEKEKSKEKRSVSKSLIDPTDKQAA